MVQLLLVVLLLLLQLAAPCANPAGHAQTPRHFVAFAEQVRASQREITTGVRGKLCAHFSTRLSLSIACGSCPSCQCC